MAANPYTPGSGFMPAYLAGREDLLKNAEEYLDSIQKQYPQRSIIYYGLRGVGKTVLLNTIEETADNLGILYEHIEVGESGKFTSNLMIALNRFAHEISIKEAAKDLAKKCLSFIKAFSIVYKIEEGAIGIESTKDISFASGVYDNDLTKIMTQIGKAANASGDTICIFIDEVQYLSEEEIGGLITAIHRCNQLRLPVMLFCAGLPKILRTVGEARSYTERLFQYEKMDALEYDEAEAAIRVPAEDFGVTYDDAAIKRIIEITGRYPYFIQELCSVVWKSLMGKRNVALHDVDSVEQQFFKTLDDGFFAVRYDRCTHLEKSFMTAMVKCGDLPCSISNVAKIMRRQVKSVSPVRAQLISKGMIYPTGHAEIDFTVPQFDAFIKRVNPELSI